MLNQLRIKQWDPSSVKPGRIFAFIGRRGSGKSYLMEMVLYHMRERFDIVIGMSPTESSLEMFRRHMPDECVFHDFSMSTVEEIMRTQRKLQKEHHRAGRPPKSVLLWCDDTMYNKATLKGTAVRDLFFNGRHLNITFVFAAQYMVDMGPDLRSQIDYVITCKQAILNERVKLHKYFFGQLKFEDYCKVMDVCTADFSALVLDSTTTSNNPTDCLFWYRAPATIPSYRLGSEAMWRLATRHAMTRSERERNGQRDDEADVRARAKGDPLTVRVADRDGNIVASDDEDVDETRGH